MNRPSANFSPARIFFAVVALVLFLSAGGARAQDRWLLIFENSAAMKKRLPAMKVELQKLFSTSMAGQIHGGDSLGVWTVDQTLHVGEFPLSIWEPESAVTSASNLVAFLEKRSYKGEANFNALQPVLGEVVTGSRRLTVLIFCEGKGEIIWTPYNQAINASLQLNYDERKKSGQPFVVLLRVQAGNYFGCSVNFPPGELNFPPFPLLPEEIKPVVPVAALEVERKTSPLDSAPLIIVGKNVETNVANLPALLAKLETNRPPVAPATVTNPAVTNAAAESVIVVASNLPPASVKFSTKSSLDNSDRLLSLVGGLALVLALVLVVLLVARSRQPSGSLITDSLKASRLPPKK